MSAIDALIWDQPTVYGAMHGTRNLSGGPDGSSCRNDARTRDLDCDLAASRRCDQRVTTDVVTSTNDKPSGYVIRRSEANDHHHPPQAGA